MAKLKINTTTFVTITIRKPEVIAVKPILDWDGFYTDYTWYLMPDGTHRFIFGDNDIYGPEDEADWECDSYDEAHDWFANYKGFEEADDPDGIFGDLDHILDWLNIRK